MGDAAIMGVYTTMKIMGSKDHALAYRAAETRWNAVAWASAREPHPMVARDGVFAFAFGAPQAVEHQPRHVAQARGWDRVEGASRGGP